MFWTTEKIKENLEYYNEYGMKFISRIEERHSPHLGKVEVVKINPNAFRNNERINISGEDVSIMCTSDTNIITFMAPVYSHRFMPNEEILLDTVLYDMEKGATDSFQHGYIDGILHISFAINSKILNIGFNQNVFPNAFSYILAGIEEIGNTLKNVRSELNSIYRI